MASRMITLFGEEIIPEELSAAPKPELEEQSTGPSILEDWKPTKQYYSIGEVAALFGVRTSNIRYWTTEFGLKVRTTRKGDRLFAATSILELRNIYHLVKERGFTIAGAKAHMQQATGMPETLDLRQALLRLRNQLLSIRNELL
jgi:DNA-binding transcriptional MerR regulator